MRFKLIAALIFSVLVSSCQDEMANQIQRIDDLNGRLTNAPALEQKPLADSLLTEYLNFVEKYAEHENAADYLFKAGELNKGLQQPMEAINCFNQLYTNYPEHEKAGTAMFLQGFTFHNELGLNELAEKSFNMFLNNYPNHPLAQDAKDYLELMKMDEGELLEFLKQKNDTIK